MFDDKEIFLDDGDDYDLDELEGKSQLGLVAKLVILLLVLALLTTLVWPLFRARPRRYPAPTPTPTPLFVVAA